VYPKKHRRQKC